MYLYHYTNSFLNIYPGDIVLNLVQLTLNRIFLRMPTFNNPETLQDTRFKVFRPNVMTQSLFVARRHVQLEGVKAPYAIVYNEQMQEVYQYQFLGNYVGKGLPQTIYYEEQLTYTDLTDTEFGTPYLSTTYPSSLLVEGVTIRDIVIDANIARIPYSFDLNVVLNSYPELLDAQTYFNTLLVTNRYHLLKLEVPVFMPKYMLLELQNRSITLALSEQETFELVGQDYYKLSVTVPIYMRLTSSQPNLQSIFDADIPIYALNLHFELDIGVINSFSVSYYTPIKGLKLVFALPITSSITATVTTTYSITRFNVLSFYPRNTFSFTIYSNTNINTENSYLFMQSFTSSPEQFAIVINKMLSFTVNIEGENSVITVLNEIYPNSILEFVYPT